MADKKKEEKKSATHTAASGAEKGGRGGSVPNNLYTGAVPSSVQQALQNASTAKKLAQAQRGLASYEKNLQNDRKTPVYETGAPADAPAAVHGFHAARNANASNDYYKHIHDNWKYSEKLGFGYRYDKNPKEAERYAFQVNSAHYREEQEPYYQKIRRESTRDMLSGMGHAAAAVGISALLGPAEFMDRVAQFSAWGTTVERPYITPWDYAREVRAGQSDSLNGVDEYGVAHKVLDEDIPILGGKGLGDLYEIGLSATESLLSANVMGGAFGAGGRKAVDAALAATAFARAATSTIDDARQAGADGKQSMAMGITMGLFEAAGEALSADDLLGISTQTSVKELLEKLLKHGALEGLTETVTEGLGHAAEYEILGDYSTFSRRRSGYLQRGYSMEEARKKAIKDSIQDLGYTMLAASASGALTGGVQSTLDGHMAALRDAKSSIEANTYSDTELFQIKRELGYLSQAYERFTPEGQQKLQSLETRYAELLNKQKNTMAAIEQKKLIEDAIRREIRENGYDMPFNPHLYRLALEMETPNGWDWMDQTMLANASKAEQSENSPAILEESGEKIDNSGSSVYNENKENKNPYRLRFMSNRDQCFRNFENVEPLQGYQDIACHADAYSFGAQDPETGELLEDISAKELAYRILDSGKYTGGPIRLLACNAGQLENGAAQQLADLLHVPVLAPTKTLFTSQDGYMAVATNESEAIDMMKQMQKRNIKSNMEGWKVYEPRD